MGTKEAAMKLWFLSLLKSHLGTVWYISAMAEVAEVVDPITAVVAAWKGNDKLCKHASTGVMAIVGAKSDIARREVCTNFDIIEPIIVHMGDSTNLGLYFLL